MRERYLEYGVHAPQGTWNTGRLRHASIQASGYIPEPSLSKGNNEFQVKLRWPSPSQQEKMDYWDQFREVVKKSNSSLSHDGWWKSAKERRRVLQAISEGKRCKLLAELELQRKIQAFQKNHRPGDVIINQTTGETGRVLDHYGALNGTRAPYVAVNGVTRKRVGLGLAQGVRMWSLKEVK